MPPSGQNLFWYCAYQPIYPNIADAEAPSMRASKRPSLSAMSSLYPALVKPYSQTLFRMSCLIPPPRSLILKKHNKIIIIKITAHYIVLLQDNSSETLLTWQHQTMIEQNGIQHRNMPKGIPTKYDHNQLEWSSNTGKTEVLREWQETQVICCMATECRDIGNVGWSTSGQVYRVCISIKILQHSVHTEGHGSQLVTLLAL